MLNLSISIHFNSSMMKYRGRFFDSIYVFPTYIPTTPKAISKKPAKSHMDNNIQ